MLHLPTRRGARRKPSASPTHVPADLRNGSAFAGLQDLSRRSFKRRVLFVTPEMTDYIKVGGLGDVSAALPRALRPGFDVRVLIPGYPEVLACHPDIEIVGRCAGLAEIPPCEIGFAETPDGLGVYILIAPDLYEREGTPYGYFCGGDFPDNDIRFARLALAAAEIAEGRVDALWSADLLHVNDWQTALAPAYLRWRQSAIPSVITIHNLAYQGLFGRDALRRIGAPDSAFQIDGVEFYDHLSFLKAGIFYASHVTTVSATYAREITTPEFGCGLEGLLKLRASQGRLTGIVNGIDGSWDPRSDDHLAIPFARGDWKGKRANADAVRQQFGLEVSRGPLFSVISRLVHQKGIDLVSAAADQIVAGGGQVVVTGRGEPQYENAIRELAARHPGRIACRIGFEEAEARRIFAGSDFLLMPSRFEPCGLSQMYAQRCGSLPIAHRTGGLTGFLFQDFSLASFTGALRRAFDTFASKRQLNMMRRIAMARSFEWTESARDYELLYMRAIGNRAPAGIAL
jgi:starch synthase